MPIKARNNEWKSFEDHLFNPISIECSYNNNLYNLDCLGDKDILALTEYSPAFDAANIIRANNDILYLVSNTGNKKGAQLLQKLLKKEIKVHILEGVYSYIHIDSTIAFLREGLILLNPERIKDKKILPKPFCDWDVIWCPEPIDIGYYSYYNNASKWINMNLFSINENLVVLEEHQHNLRKELEKYKIECAMLPMRHQRTLGGGFHCVTLDLERK
jgi:N-dimethylarginine dimethylaminohydrolase